MTPPPNAIASPCIGVCALDPATGRCDGCLRTIDEIAAWGALDERSRREIWKRLPARRHERDAAKPEAA
jgi:predicted Fe-S protein YdhL (DUF1289 family)